MRVFLAQCSNVSSALARIIENCSDFSAKQRAKSSGARASSATLSTTGSSLGEMSPPESHVGAEMSDRTTKKVRWTGSKLRGRPIRTSRPSASFGFAPKSLRQYNWSIYDTRNSG